VLQWNHRFAALVVLAVTLAAFLGQGGWFALRHLGW
jgi:hypothetical protein